MPSPPLVWTREAPREPGWYWLRSPYSGTETVHVFDTSHGLVAKGWGYIVDCGELEFSGPIPPPQEPTP